MPISVGLRQFSARGLCALLTCAFLVTVLPEEASAWEYESCSSKLITEVDNSAPQVMLMLDRSGSMAYRPDVAPPKRDDLISRYNQVENGQYVGWVFYRDWDFYSNAWRDPKSTWQCGGNGVCNAEFTNQPAGTERSWGEDFRGHWDRTHWIEPPQDTLMSLAKEKLGEVASDYDNASNRSLKFGLGTFSSSYSIWAPAPSSQWARIWSEANAYVDSATLMDPLNHIQQGAPIGGTPTARAIEVMRTSQTVSNQNTATAGILITDGQPTVSETGDNGDGLDPEHRHAALREACDHRDVADMYVIGFSQGANQSFNNLLAAAGGTGSCCSGSGCSPSTSSNTIDPCGISASAAVSRLNSSGGNAIRCTGSYQADSGNELKDALDTITRQISCTYPLDVSQTPGGQAPDDASGARVFLDSCNSSVAEHTLSGNEYDTGRSNGRTTANAPSGLACNGACGYVVSDGQNLTYDMETKANETNTVRIRVADYLHNCSDPVTFDVYEDNNPIGSWTGTGTETWREVEFQFTPDSDATFITIVQSSDAYCAGSRSCDPGCEGDLNLYLDSVTVESPEAGCDGSDAEAYGSAWVFNDDRNQVELQGSTCDAVKSGTIDRVITQVACPCEYQEGTPCPGSAPGGRCEDATWTCSDEWEDECTVPPDADCNDNCAPKTQHDTTFANPNVQLAVDNSGSMGNGRFTYNGRTRNKHWTAKAVVGDVADWSYRGAGCDRSAQTCDRVKMGIHYWASGRNAVESAQEDFTKGDVHSLFDTYRPGGGTDFRQAARLLRDEPALMDASSPNFGLIVTDGAPNPRSSVRGAADILCTLRERSSAPVGTNVLGFGSGNDEAVNSFIAAAGGTGSCCEGNGCDPTDVSQKIDPCDFKGGEPGRPDRSLEGMADSIAYNDNSQFDGGPVTCTGNIPATDANALKSELINLFGNLQCSFPLELLPGDSSAPDNPEGTFVDIHLSSVTGVVSVPHVDNDAAQTQFSNRMNAKLGDGVDRSNEGWRFGNQGRTYVELTDGLCDLIANEEIPQVDTQVCDTCERTGESCVVPCDGSESYCDSEGNKVGRCREGVYKCIDYEDVCVQRRSAMPEICNGLDDSCDGKTDNLSENDDKWTANKWDLQDNYGGNYAGWSCYNRNVCYCPSGQPDTAGGLASDVDEYKSMLANQEATGECRCGEGLDYTPDGRPYVNTYEPELDDEINVGCSNSGGGQPSPWSGILLGIGSVALLLRRKRS